MAALAGALPSQALAAFGSWDLASPPEAGGNEANEGNQVAEESAAPNEPTQRNYDTAERGGWGLGNAPECEESARKTASGIFFGQEPEYTGKGWPQTQEPPRENGDRDNDTASDMRKGGNVCTYVVQNPWTCFDPLGLLFEEDAYVDYQQNIAEADAMDVDRVQHYKEQAEVFLPGVGGNPGSYGAEKSRQKIEESKQTIGQVAIWAAIVIILEEMARDNSGGENPSAPSGQDISDENTGTKEKFDRPNGVPENWEERPSKNDKGTQWVNPENKHDRVRSMPAQPDSPNPGQQKPYTERRKDGKWYDAQVNEVERKSEESHVPTDDYEHFDPEPKKDSSL